MSSMAKVETRRADVAAPETKLVSNGQSSTPGHESEHDYTVIGGSSPPKAEDR